MPLIQCDFFSDALKISTSMNVILPQPTKAQIGMENAAGEAFGARKVMYLLHGLSDDHTIWQRRTSIERYVAPTGLAVVMPSVNRSFYTDMHAGAAYWTFISEEVPRLAQSLFGLSAAREDNFVAGLSMGGYGAFKVALRKPDRFCAAYSLSGVLDIAARCEGAKDQSELARTFGDLKKVRGSQEDLFALAEQLADGAQIPKLGAWCGTEDSLLPGNRHFRDHCAELNLPLEYREDPGAHTWDRWDREIQYALRFFGFEPGK